MHIPGRTFQHGNGRFRDIPAISWKQYSGKEFSVFFPMISGCFLPESRGIWQESTGKIRAVFDRNPGRGGTAGNGRKALEIAGKWKQYSGRKSPDFFPVYSGQLPAGKHRKLTGIHRKKIREFPAGILLPPSSDFPCFPVVSRRTATTWGVLQKFTYKRNGCDCRNDVPGYMENGNNKWSYYNCWPGLAEKKTVGRSDTNQQC